LSVGGFGSGAVISGEEGDDGNLFDLEVDGEKLSVARLLGVGVGLFVAGVGLGLLEAQHEDAELGGGFKEGGSEVRLGVGLGVEKNVSVEEEMVRGREGNGRVVGGSGRRKREVELFL